MQNVFVIKMDCGQWDDHTSLPMFVLTDENDARAKLVSLADEFSGVFALMLYNIAHGGNHYTPIPDVDQNIHAIAIQCYWDNGMTLMLSSMPVGQTFNGETVMARISVPFYPRGWDEDYVDRHGPELYDTRYERMARGIENRFEGWKH